MDGGRARSPPSLPPAIPDSGVNEMHWRLMNALLHPDSNPQ